MEQYATLQHSDHFQIVIINYDLLIRDVEAMMALRADGIICDEVSAIKNKNAKRTKEINKLASKVKFALSATPLENSPSELYSICNWLDPAILGNWWEFNDQYVIKDVWGGVNRFKNLEILKRKISGIMIRRRKDEVLDQLPDIVTQVREIEFDKTTRMLYDAVAGELSNQVELLNTLGRNDPEAEKGFEKNKKVKSARGNILAMFTLLKQVCDDARLLQTSKSEYAQELLTQIDVSKTKSNKINEVMAVCEEVVHSGQKIVIFSEYKRMIYLLADELKKLTKIVECHGDISEPDRHKNRKQFWDDDKTQIFLSTDAGKYGQNLQCASYLMNIDIPWNPATMEQRIGRIYRMGSVI